LDALSRCSWTLLYQSRVYQNSGYGEICCWSRPNARVIDRFLRRLFPTGIYWSFAYIENRALSQQLKFDAYIEAALAACAKTAGHASIQAGIRRLGPASPTDVAADINVRGRDVVFAGDGVYPVASVYWYTFVCLLPR